MMNQKRGLTDKISFLAMESRGQQTALLKCGAKEKYQLNPGTLYFVCFCESK